MSKTFNSSFLTHLQGEVTTLAQCYKITRTDGVVKGFTSLDQDLVIDTVTYKALTGAVSSTFEESSDLRVNNLDLQGVISSPDITEDDLLSGKYSQALIEIFLVNYLSLPTSLTDKTLIKWVATGYLGEIRLVDGKFIIEVRSISQLLAQSHLELYSPRCRAKRLGDTRCKVSMTSRTFSYTVATVPTTSSLTHSSTAQADNYFTYGIIKFTSGSNDDLEFMVKQYLSGVIYLTEAPYFPIQVGDTFRAYQGCDRKFETCRDTFDNVKNFRGEPIHLFPGTDKISKVQ